MRWVCAAFTLLLCALMSCQKIPSPYNRETQTLRLNLRMEPCSLDPRKGNEVIASQIHFLLFEGLVRLNADMSISPAQASSYEVSHDGKVYTFHLKETVWSDGTPVTAHDFAKSWKMILSPQFPSPDAYLLYAICNAKLAKAGKIPLEQVGIHAQDDKTLVVELESPAPNFLQIAASSVLLPVSAKVEETNPDWASSSETIISNGPFCLKKWIPNHALTFDKNPSYRNSKEVKLDHILVDILDREMSSLHMYASGYFDLVGSPLSFFPSAIIDDLTQQNLLSFFPVAGTYFVAFNTIAAPFHNANIRRAFSYAISRKLLVEHITRLKEETALNILPPALIKESKAYFLDQDIERARFCLTQGLKELGVEQLEAPRIMFVNSDFNKRLVQALQQNWRDALGIEVALEPVEFKTLHENSDKGNFSLGIFAWLADYADPMNILERFSDRTNHRNYCKWEHTGYIRLLEEAKKTPDRSEYLVKIQEAEKLMIEEMPLTCLFHANYAFLIHSHVKDVEVSPLGHIYFDKISINVAKQQRGNRK